VKPIEKCVSLQVEDGLHIFRLDHQISLRELSFVSTGLVPSPSESLKPFWIVSGPPRARAGPRDPESERRNEQQLLLE